MKIGILGGGNVGGTLGEALSLKEHEIAFGVRDADSPEMKALLGRCKGRAKAGSAEEAVRFGEVVINALPWEASREVLQASEWKGKILLDATNPLLPRLAGLELGTTTSGGEKAAEWAAGARVVKIFNTTGFGNMANPVYEGKAIPIFYCGDDAEAKKTAAQLAKDVGFDPVDAGPLSNARYLEPLAYLWIWLANIGGVGREMAFQMVKR